VIGFFGPPTRSATTSCSTRTRARDRGARAPAFPAPAEGPAKKASRTPGAADFVAPRGSRRARLCRRLRRHRRHRHRAARCSASRPRTTTIRHPAQGPGRPPGRGLRRAAARARAREFWGYAPDEKLGNEQLIREEYRGIRPAPGYPACPDHTEKATLFGCWTSSARRHRADRVLRHVSDRGGQRLVFLASAVALPGGRPHRSRPGRGLRAPQGHVASRRSSAGWRPISATSPRSRELHDRVSARFRPAAGARPAPPPRRAARLLRRIPLQPARDRPGLEHQPRAARGAGLLTVIAGLLPAGVAWIGAQIVDAVVRRATCRRHNIAHVLRWCSSRVLVAAMAGAQRGLSLCQSLLRAQLGQRVNVMILEKALTLELRSSRIRSSTTSSRARAARPRAAR
jgi:hypothetical protein